MASWMMRCKVRTAVSVFLSVWQDRTIGELLSLRSRDIAKSGPLGEHKIHIGDMQSNSQDTEAAPYLAISSRRRR